MDELTPAQVEELRQDLLALKATLTAALEGPLEHREAEEHRLALTRQALAAIEAGEYGTCKRCEELIGYERLKARPEAAYCANCAGGHHR
ncbi:MAG: TraR/DksA C4-type zinc finger protein [Myxococcales bacterium]|nr:TraR/DksA C4-type zinc finger protein [Myxococcales bacterium]MCB9650210.1 TraR/DksA C4-type zinc finger protein [Deltaproteobacteria bacterium]